MNELCIVNIWQPSLLFEFEFHKIYSLHSSLSTTFRYSIGPLRYFYLWKDSILIILLFTEFTDCLIENFVKSNMIDLRLTCGLNWSHLFSIFLFLLYIFTTLEQFYHTPLLLLSKQRMRYLPEFSQQHLAQLFFSFSVFLKFCKGFH